MVYEQMFTTLTRQ